METIKQDVDSVTETNENLSENQKMLMEVD